MIQYDPQLLHLVCLTGLVMTQNHSKWLKTQGNPENYAQNISTENYAQNFSTENYAQNISTKYKKFEMMTEGQWGSEPDWGPNSGETWSLHCY